MLRIIPLASALCGRNMEKLQKRRQERDGAVVEETVDWAEGFGFFLR